MLPLISEITGSDANTTFASGTTATRSLAGLPRPAVRPSPGVRFPGDHGPAATGKPCRRVRLQRARKRDCDPFPTGLQSRPPNRTARWQSPFGPQRLAARIPSPCHSTCQCPHGIRSPGKMGFGGRIELVRGTRDLAAARCPTLHAAANVPGELFVQRFQFDECSGLQCCHRTTIQVGHTVGGQRWNPGPRG